MKFTVIYQEYWPKIYRLALGFVNDPAWAKDITQDTFVVVYQQLVNFRNEAAIGTWIFRIATNQCLRQLEHSKRMPSTEPPILIYEESSKEQEKRSAFLYKCIAALPEVDRLIISLELEDIDQKEIAKILGMSAVNIRVKIHRIKEKLTEKFKNYE